MKKKKWGKPKLIVLTRGDRQESVLCSCKDMAVGGGTGASFVYPCWAQCGNPGWATCSANCPS